MGLQVNNSIHVNSMDVPKSDLMATNGVIHVVNNLLYPAGWHFTTKKKSSNTCSSLMMPDFFFFFISLQTFRWVARTCCSSSGS